MCKPAGELNRYVMEPTQWLERYVPGFRELSAEERNAISDFALLWSLFEARALNSGASAKSIVALVRKWSSDGGLGADAFHDTLHYFRGRYFPHGKPSEHFQGLHLRPNDNPQLVLSVLSGNSIEADDCIAVVLIIIYRFRNNLFHGIKWAYGIRDQLDNFNWANAALMLALERAHEG